MRDFKNRPFSQPVMWKTAQRQTEIVFSFIFIFPAAVCRKNKNLGGIWLDQMRIGQRWFSMWST
jgi:hypothetical protein